MDLNRFKVDTRKENEGAWVEIADGCRLCIARLNNVNYKREIEKLRAPYQRGWLE